MTARTQSLSGYIAEQMKRPSFWKGWDALDPEFSLIEQLIELRLRRGLTQAQLAKRAGTKQPSIARLEGGPGTPSLPFLRRVADALEANVEIRFRLKEMRAAPTSGRRTPAKVRNGQKNRHMQV